MAWKRHQGVIVHYAHNSVDADEFGFYKGTAERAPRETGTVYVPIFFAAGCGEEIYRAAYEAVIGKPAAESYADDKWDFEITGIESPVMIAVKEG